MSFTWAYILNVADLLPAMNVLSVITVVQPTTVASGTAAPFAVVMAAPTATVWFFVQYSVLEVLVGVATSPIYYDDITGGGLFQVRVVVPPPSPTQTRLS